MDNDPKMPSYMIPNLETHLNLIALKKKGHNIDEYTRRSLLRLYTELLDPAFRTDIMRVNKPDYLVMKFVSCANKELTKLGVIRAADISDVVFKQADTFVSILIGLIKKDKDESEVLIAKLKENREALKPKSAFVKDDRIDENDTYPNPSFRVTDMDQSLITLTQQIFQVDQVKIQQDIFKFKDLALIKSLNKDLAQVQFYLQKDLGYYNPSSFRTAKDYQSWKLKENEAVATLLEKYKVPPHLKLLPIADLPSGYNFYILPPGIQMRSYFVHLVKLCFQTSQSTSSEDDMLLSKQCTNLLNLVSKTWRMFGPTKIVLSYTAAHIAGILTKENTQSISLENSTKLFERLKFVIEQERLDWTKKETWPILDQEEYIHDLSLSYSNIMHSLKDNLQLVFNRTTNKPSFGPFLAFLGDNIESDCLFVSLQPLLKKWEKRLIKTLLRIAESRYAEILSNLPRDNTLSLIHILNICDSIIDDLKFLQKKYKFPLLGFLYLPKSMGSIITSMFAADAKNILKHIDNYTKSKGEFLSFSDALEAYKVLNEIRDIHKQVTPNASNSTFKFNLENFFYPHLQAWVHESAEKILTIVVESIRNDDYTAIDLLDDEKKFSSSVLDIFTLIKEYLRILNSLNWDNEFQLAMVYTTLLKNISDGVVRYANYIAEKVIKELDEEVDSPLDSASSGNTNGTNSTDPEKRARWYDEVKNAVVSNIQGTKSLDFLTHRYNFKPEICIAINNLSAMMKQLTKLEDLLDPELISNSVAEFDPKSNKNYLSHLFSIRLIKAENLKSSSNSSLQPYVTLIDTKVKKTIGRTRSIKNTPNPEWDEEFEINLPPNSTLTISLTVWDEKFGTHAICGRSLLQLDPRRFKHDGIPQEIYLDLDSQGRILIEVAVESERNDAIFVVGRAHRTLKRVQDRCIKLIVEKFSTCIQFCFSRNTLKSICGNNGLLKPSQEQMDAAMAPLYDYLNMNLQVLAEFLTKELLDKVMIAAWEVVISSADELLLPKLSSAKTFKLSLNLSNNGNNEGSWQSAVTSAVANVTSSIGISGYGKKLTTNEMEAVFSWLNYLCFDFFHNDGNGPPVKDLKNANYQALLLLPVYYDSDSYDLTLEVERLSPAFVKTVRDRNNFGRDDMPKIGNLKISQGTKKRQVSRIGTLHRSNTVSANATARSRALVAQETEDARSDPIAAQTAAEDIILRILILKDEKVFVAKRLDQRERLAHSISTERLARAAAEGRF